MEQKKSIIPGDDPHRCYLCGRAGEMVVHHAIHGTANRRLSDKYGLTVHLCTSCHGRLHDMEGHPGDLFLKQEAERAFSKKYGHDKWFEVFGKSYLWIIADTVNEDWINGS